VVAFTGQKMKLFITLVAFLACVSLALSVGVQIGTCYLRGTTNDPGVSGKVTFTLLGANSVQVTTAITGITTNPSADHGLHIHQYGDLSATDGTSAGGHWNPAGVLHSCPTGVRHQGDMGNWTATAGAITLTKTFDLIDLAGTTSILGRAVVLHSTFDNCVTDPTGNAGIRLATCVIGVSDPGANNTNNAISNSVVPLNTGICILVGTTGNNVTGTIYLSQANSTAPTRVYGVINGLPLGSMHGFHIHEFGDLSNPAGTAAGAHFNPTGETHGIPPYPTRHVGDMGIIYYFSGAAAYYDYTNDKISLTGGQTVIGHAIIVHNVTDNCTPPTGAAGSRLAQCVIGVMNTLTAPVFPGAGVPTTQDDTPCLSVYATTMGASSSHKNFASSNTVAFGLVVLALLISLMF